MEVYLAGLYAGRYGVSKTQSLHLRISQLIRKYPYILESFHYMKPTMPEKIREHGNRIFLDSGAFSIHTQGVKIDLKEYARFIRENGDIISVASNLDAIGAGNEQLSYDRQKELEGMGVKIQPVHHFCDHDDWLKRYLDEGYDYIFLGGMVGKKTTPLKRWLDHVWSKYLTNNDGTPKLKVHGFGLTTLELMFEYPWTSVDSTSWVTRSRNGGIFLDLPQSDGSIKDFTIEFSRRSAKRCDPESGHFDCLRTAERKEVLERLEQLEAERPKFPEEIELQKIAGYKMGLNPKALAGSYGWRDIANIAYFQRIMSRANKPINANSPR
jgi:hypothetical protein